MGASDGLGLNRENEKKTLRGAGLSGYCAMVSDSY